MATPVDTLVFKYDDDVLANYKESKLNVGISVEKLIAIAVKDTTNQKITDGFFMEEMGVSVPTSLKGNVRFNVLTKLIDVPIGYLKKGINANERIINLKEIGDKKSLIYVLDNTLT